MEPLPRTLSSGRKKTKDGDQADWKGMREEGENIYKEVGRCIDQGLGPRDDQVHSLIVKHFLLRDLPLLQMIRQLQMLSHLSSLVLVQSQCLTLSIITST